MLNKEKTHKISLTILIILMIVVVFSGLRARADLISATLPYCRHVDENVWAMKALNIIQTGDLNPHRFTKPSVPAYLMAVGFALGFLHSAGKYEVKRVKEIGSAGYPFYKNKTAAFMPRLIFAFLSVLVLVFIGFIGYRIFNVPLLIFLAPLILSISDLYLHMSWNHLNVDIVGCFFIFALLLFLIRAYDVPTNGYFIAIVAGLLCGLTLGSKYNLFPVFLPCFLYLIFNHQQRWVTLSIITLSTMMITFAATSPYVIFDFPSFINGAGHEVRHYAAPPSETWKQHYASSGEPGWPQFLFYSKNIVSAYGWLLSFFAFIGFVSAFRFDWKKASIILSFPLVFLIYMCQQEVHFTRNIVSVHVVFALLAAYGLVVVYRLLTVALCHSQLIVKQAGSNSLLPSSGHPKPKQGVHFLNAIWHHSLTTSSSESFNTVRKSSANSTRRLIALYVGVFLISVVLVSVSLPWDGIRDAYDTHKESRNDVTAWIKKNLPQDSTILVASDLHLDTRPLEKNYIVSTVSVQSLKRHLRTGSQTSKGTYIIRPDFKEKWLIENFKDSKTLVHYQGHVVPKNISASKVLNPGIAVIKLPPSNLETIKRDQRKKRQQKAKKAE